MIELQMIEINFIKKAIFFILRRLFRRLFQKKVHFLSSPVVIPVVISKKGPFFYPPVVIPVVISKKGPFFYPLVVIPVVISKKGPFFYPLVVIPAVIQKNVRAGLSARGSLGAPFGRKPSLVHFLCYCWSLHPFLISIICYSNICNFFFLNDRCSKGG